MIDMMRLTGDGHLGVAMSANAIFRHCVRSITQPSGPEEHDNEYRRNNVPKELHRETVGDEDQSSNTSLA